MIVVYTGETPPESFSKSLFLVGPTPRAKNVLSWRPLALRILEEMGYDGVVFNPEYRPGTIDWEKTNALDYDVQVGWEHESLNMSDHVIAWVPRTLDDMPAFTTNVEFGLLARSRKLSLGAPPNAKKMGYLKYCANKYEIPIFDTLPGIIREALKRIGKGALRSRGERNIPLFLWNAPRFQAWYSAQKAKGNYLNGAEVLFTPITGSGPFRPFYFALKPDIHIESENRDKNNKTEIVFSRWDISSVLLYKRASNYLDTKIVLGREFRTPVNNASGFIWELPGGSSPDFSLTPKEIAVEEVWEEVGLRIDLDRFVFCGSRQLMGTMSTHKAHLFSVELTDEEMAYIRSQEGIPHWADLNKNPSGERVYLEIKTVREVIAEELVDWSNAGMILAALQKGR